MVRLMSGSGIRAATEILILAESELSLSQIKALTLTGVMSSTRPRPGELITGPCAAGIFVVDRHNLDIGYQADGANNSITDYPF